MALRIDTVPEMAQTANRLSIQSYIQMLGITARVRIVTPKTAPATLATGASMRSSPDDAARCSTVSSSRACSISP